MYVWLAVGEQLTYLSSIYHHGRRGSYMWAFLCIHYIHGVLLCEKNVLQKSIELKPA